MVDAHRLRIFSSVMASGTVSAAADSLGMTPSAVSQQIAALQKETGLTLFERAGRSIRPTTQAVALAHESERLLGELHRVDTVIADLRAGHKGELSIGYFSSAGARWMPQLAKQLLARMPDLTLQMVLTEGYPPGESPPVDIDVVPDDPATAVRPGHTVTPLMSDPFVALVPVGHRLAGRRRVEMAELADEAFVSNDISAGITQDMIDRACRAAGFRPRYTVEAQDHYTAIAFVAAGVGITVVPDLASRALPKSVRKLQLIRPHPVRDIVALTAPGARSNEAARTGVDLLRGIARSTARRSVRSD